MHLRTRGKNFVCVGEQYNRWIFDHKCEVVSSRRKSRKKPAAAKPGNGVVKSTPKIGKIVSGRRTVK